jgi:cell division protein FtsW (lipid II flippase)
MSIATAMTFQIFMNIGMTLGFLPVIGVPLPLMSARTVGIIVYISSRSVSCVSVRMRRL